MAASMQTFSRVCSTKHPIKELIRWQITKCSALDRHKNGVHTSCRLLADVIPETFEQKTENKAEKISKAMRLYMERAKNYNSMIDKEIDEYEVGKRHLANIMGEDPDSFNQDDIDRAIKYLLPSGLFEKRARPQMKHPYEVFPQRKEALFGKDGRPHHYQFYTGKPNYHGLLHDINMKYEHLNATETELYKNGKMAEEEDKKLFLHGFQWIDHKTLTKQLIEEISPQEYNRFVLVLHRLLKHKLSYKEEEFLLKYSKKVMTMSQFRSIEKPLIDSDGREYSEATGRRKTSNATVTVYNNGSGQISINGQDLAYFKDIHQREQLLFPLQLVNKIDKVDIVATVEGGGSSGQTGAIRLALAHALCSFVDTDSIERLRLAGLLTKDPRTRERKKPGQPGARKKPTWLVFLILMYCQLLVV
ncbi:hypothetical protein SNE40_018840 [Patella caerulea]|uniref:Small ribosomal subunit protein uS9m n=1 Tax=Patella caerulea TaxID=87958 RepID=A0AAN8J798_PATCE